MKSLNATVIANLIEAHIEGDEKKFKAYAEFIADAYEERQDILSAAIIRLRLETPPKEKTATLD